MSKIKPRICKSCTNKAIKHRLECWACRAARYRAMYPLKYAFWDLRTNSKRRGVPFHLTLEQFKNFCEKFEYMTKQGRTKQCYSIDRIKIDVGYEIGNLKMIPVSENSSKRWLEYVQYPDGKGSIKWLTYTPSTFEDVPF